MAKVTRPTATELAQVTNKEVLIKEFKEDYEANKPREFKLWTTVLAMTLKEFTENIDPTYKDVVRAYVVERVNRETGKHFNKVIIEIGTTRCPEYDLSWDKENRLFCEEGDELDPESLLFCREVCGKDKHTYITGELL